MDDPVLVVRAGARSCATGYPDLPIIARARDTDHAAELYQAGVTDAVPETLEASLQLSEAVLVDLGVAMGPVIASIHEKRERVARARSWKAASSSTSRAAASAASGTLDRDEGSRLRRSAMRRPATTRLAAACADRRCDASTAIERHRIDRARRCHSVSNDVDAELASRSTRSCSMATMATHARVHETMLGDALSNDSRRLSRRSSEADTRRHRNRPRIARRIARRRGEPRNATMQRPAASTAPSSRGSRRGSI